MTEPLNPTQIALHLAELARDLDTTVGQLKVVDHELTEKRAAADLAYSRAFLGAAGSVDARKHQAAIETHEQRLAADLADAMFRHLRRRTDAIKVRIDVGRTYNAAVRAEIALGGNGYDA
jgi:hypothetical protein